MKKFGKLFAVMCVSFIGAANADDAIKHANRQASVSVGRETISYHEYDKYGQTNGGWLDSEKGTISQFQVAYTLQTDADWYLNAAYAYGKGKTKYDGYLMYSDGSMTPYQSNTDVATSDFNLRYGKGFRFVGDSLQLTPLLEYQYHTWKRDLAPGDSWGYREDYYHNAVSLGLLGQYALTQSLVVSLSASYGMTVNPRMKIEHSPTFTLKSRPITTYGVALDYKLSDRFRVHGGYQQKQYKYGESDVEYGGLYEPESKTTLSSYYLGVGYAY